MSFIIKLVKKAHNLYIAFNCYKKEKKYIIKRKNLFKDVSLSREQIELVDNIWLKNYGKKISKDWHKLYTSYTGIFNEYYFPDIYFNTKILKILNPEKRKRYLSDKVLTPYLFSNLKEEKARTIKNYIYNCNGYFYGEKGIISYESALDIIKNVGEVIIKPSVDSNSGNNVKLLNIENGIDINSNMSTEEILKKYKQNYMIQEKIKQHESFAKLNPSSVNTIRLNTYILDGEIYNTPIAMRLGRNNSIVDNAHAGGIAVGIDDRGCLRKYAFSEKGEKFLEHPNTHIVFENYKIPKIKEMCEFVLKNHYRIPHMGIVGWDLTLDENENIVIIETNITTPSIWFPQYCNGEGFFKENTERIIRMLKEKGKEK